MDATPATIDHLLGHSFSGTHSLVCVSDPGQGSPPNSAGGLSHDLVLVYVPFIGPPVVDVQLIEHSVYGPQPPQLPLTVQSIVHYSVYLLGYSQKSKQRKGQQRDV